jgi:Ser-tRNA(Ala) deacylase AlaX
MTGTEPLFRDDAYLRACAARVTAHAPGGLILDRTVFYATGGGQPGDTGEIVWEGGSLAIAGAEKAADGILHRAAEGAALPPVGAEVEARLDWDRRYRHMRCHTALHLLSVVLPLPVTGGSIGAEKGRLDFDMPEAPGEKATLEERLRALVGADHAVAAEWIEEAALDASPGLVKTMAVQPPRGEGRVRLVRIGAGDAAVDLQPCGGTHVARTGEIGAVSIGKIEKKGRQNRRVSILLG